MHKLGDAGKLPKLPPPSNGAMTDDEFELRCEAANITAILFQGTGRSNQMFDTLRRVESYLRNGVV